VGSVIVWSCRDNVEHHLVAQTELKQFSMLSIRRKPTILLTEYDFLFDLLESDAILLNDFLILQNRLLVRKNFR
jgi:hypothetical protein